MTKGISEVGDLKTTLQDFNRKERYWVVRNALGVQNQEIRLSESFRNSLQKAIGKEIKEDAWWALDYHIDWLFGALFHIGDPENREGVNEDSGSSYLKGTQEDFDFVVAFDKTIVLMEAKGVTGWKKEQLKRKHERIELLERVAEKAGVGLIFVTWSPKKTDAVCHLELWFDDPDKEFKIINRIDETGTHWKLASQKKPVFGR